MRVHPSLRVRAVADDNVFLESDAEGDLALWLLPRLELDYTRRALHAQLDAAANFRRHLDESSLNEEYPRLSGLAEVELLRGLTLSAADAYVPYPLRTGLPEDASANLIQTNRAEATLRYRRPLPREGSIELGFTATRFTTRSFAASIDTDGDGIDEVLPDFRGDFTETAVDVELQRALGRRAFVYARSELRSRELDELTNSDFDELSTLLGMRVHWPARLELDVAAGYGRIDFDDLDDSDRFLGIAQLEWALPHGMTWLASAENRFTTDASGRDFVETSARMGLRKRLSRRMEASLDVAWSRFDDDSSGVGDDQYVVASARLRRQLARHLQAALAYRYWRNGGSDSSDDLRQNRVIFELTYAR